MFEPLIKELNKFTTQQAQIIALLTKIEEHLNDQHNRNS
jgi:hypothetical protein